MKCPKCGYNSFEYHDSCKKCSADVSAYKQTFNITPIVMPPEVKLKKADEFRSASSSNEKPVESVETHDDMFAFDLPDDVTPSAASQNDDPFNFDDDLPVAESQQTKVEDEGFSDLLETTSQSDADPFASYTAASNSPPAVAVAPTSGPGEFDLESFSWDETPAATATAGGEAADDDFDSLFGDASDGAKK
ncbi:MAG: hypothetical protein Q7W05_02465 [Deltaproteobacteria bacterium]|nr:hypothetical protein [Deltaproteobacteria bacterium]